MQFFELGAAYAQARREEEAQRTLQRAVDLGPDSVREAAQRELAKIAGNRIP
jgi:Flp pilus assembly protein TadD